MQLTLSILAGPDGIARDSRVFAPGTFGIGRADDNDWVLPDPHRHLSKRHCSIAFQDGFWTLTDFSTNGTFLNDERGPLGQRGVRELRDGDRLRLGGYEIAVSIAEAGSLRQDPPATGRLASSFGGTDSAAFVRPFDPSGPIPFAPPFDGAAEEPFAGDVRPDHTPGIEDAFQPPRPVVLLDEDWDLSESVAAVQPPPPAIKPDLVSNPVAPVQPVTDDLLAAFLRGAGMPEAKPADPVAAMESLGAAFRALASGLRETLMARAAVKGEFRIEQTMIRTHGNNPLKFSASDEDALLALLGAGRRSEMGAAEAVAEALRDIRMHELATIAAMQAAVRGVLRELDPATLRDGAPGGGLLASQRKVRAWDAFEAAHARITQAMSDNFDSAFGRAFARAYGQALREIRPEAR